MKIIPLSSNTSERSSYGPGHFTVDQTLFVKKLHKPSGTTYPIRFSLGGWDATGQGRILHGGPMVAGPYLFGFQKATVMSADRKGSGWEHTEGVKAGTEIEVENGDILELAGEKYLVAISGNNSDREINLTRIVEMVSGPDGITAFIFEELGYAEGKTGKFTVYVRDDDSGGTVGTTLKIPTLEMAREYAQEGAGLAFGKPVSVTL